MKYLIAAAGLADEIEDEYNPDGVVRALNREGFLAARLRTFLSNGLGFAAAKRGMRQEIGEAIAVVRGA